MKRPGFDDDSEDTTPRLPMEAVLEVLGVRWPPHGLSVQEILGLRGFTVTELDLGNQTMTLQRFAKEHPKGKFYFTVKGAFIVALVDGCLTDTSGGKLDKRFLRTAHRVEDPVLEEPAPVITPEGIPRWMLMSEDPAVQLAVRNMRAATGEETSFKRAEPVTRVRTKKKNARQRRGSA